VAEWQTRRIQNPLSERVCGFESHLRYQGGMIGFLGARRPRPGGLPVRLVARPVARRARARGSRASWPRARGSPCRGARAARDPAPPPCAPSACSGRPWPRTCARSDRTRTPRSARSRGRGSRTFREGHGAGSGCAPRCARGARRGRRPPRVGGLGSAGRRCSRGRSSHPRPRTRAPRRPRWRRGRVAARATPRGPTQHRSRGPTRVRPTSC
jgi:hypothetical protein